MSHQKGVFRCHNLHRSDLGCRLRTSVPSGSRASCWQFSSHFFSVGTTAAQYQGTEIWVHVHTSTHASDERLRVVGLDATYSDANRPTDNFSLACGEFAARSKEFSKGCEMDLKPDGKRRDIFWVGGADSLVWKTCRAHPWSLRDRILAGCSTSKAGFEYDITGV